MWVALFDFCLIVLLFSFLLFGLREWNSLLTDDSDETAHMPAPEELRGRFFSLWVLIIGLGSVSIVSGLVEWLNSWTL